MLDLSYNDEFPSDVSYSGLDDTADGFSGSYTLQNVDLGSSLPLTLPSSSNEADPWFSFSTSDFIDQNDPWSALQLSGVSDPPFASALDSTPWPDSQEQSGSGWSAFTSLSKLGSSFASLFGNHPQTMQPAVAVQTGALPTRSLLPVTANGTNTVLLLIVAGAAIFLLLRSGGIGD